MTDDQLQSAASALVRRSTTEQGLPEQVVDATALRRVAALLGPERGDTPDAAPGHRKDSRRLASVEEVCRG